MYPHHLDWGRGGDTKEMGPFLETTCSESFSSVVKTPPSALAVNSKDCKCVSPRPPCPLGQLLCTELEWWHRQSSLAFKSHVVIIPSKKPSLSPRSCIHTKAHIPASQAVSGCSLSSHSPLPPSGHIPPVNESSNKHLRSVSEVQWFSAAAASLIVFIARRLHVVCPVRPWRPSS